MTVISFKRHMAGAKKNICLGLAFLMTICSGCGREQSQMRPEDVELFEPVSVAASYETAARRNLYNASVYSAIVTPYVEEYQLDESITFAAYDTFPGEAVKQGGTLLHGNVENINQQIEYIEESIADMDESYQEFLADNTKAMQQPLEDERVWGSAIDNWNKEKPEEFLNEIDPDTGKEIQVQNPEYASWNQQYKQYEGLYVQARQSIIELEEARKERTELYELDRAYSLLQIKRLKEDRNRKTLVSGMEGYVAGLDINKYEGSWVGSGESLMAVCDPSRVEMRCEYISKTEIKRAEDVFAIVNGKRYEVEYQELSHEEYERQKVLNGGSVYSTFRVLTDAEELEMGSYAVIVMKLTSRENVLTVPKDAVQHDGGISYVYLVNGNTNVYTVVKTGMSDGMYTEILSGVEEGDKVLTDRAVTAGEDTVTVERGTMSNTFSSYGFVEYLSSETVYNPVEYGTCYFVENVVKQYQEVEKGQVLARIRVVPDQNEIGRNEQKLLRERERLEDLKKDGEEKNKKAIAQKEETIRDLEELITDMKADAALTEIKAPRSGVITDVLVQEEESLLGQGAVLFVLADESSSYVMINDEKRQLAYGNVVEIQYVDKLGKDTTTTGEVVTLNKMCMTDNLSRYLPLARIPLEDLGNMEGSYMSGSGWWGRRIFDVTATIRSMENVLIVPKRAVTLSAGNTYVKVRLESGEIQYRSFIAGGSDDSNYWVVEGLTEGMEICLE